MHGCVRVCAHGNYKRKGLRGAVVNCGVQTLSKLLFFTDWLVKNVGTAFGCHRSGGERGSMRKRASISPSRKVVLPLQVQIRFQVIMRGIQIPKRTQPNTLELWNYNTNLFEVVSSYNGFHFICSFFCLKE